MNQGTPISALPTQPQPSIVQPVSFRGQQPGERVAALRRGAVGPLLARGWPVGVGLSLLALTLWGQGSGALAGPVAATLALGMGGATLVLLAYWGCTYAAPWWFRLAIVTDRRVILSQGIVRAEGQEVPLGAVGVVEVVSPNVMERLLGYGDVVVASGGGAPIRIVGIARPALFAEAIDAARATHAPSPKPAPRADDALQGVLDRLSQGEALPPLPELDRALTRNWPLRHAVTPALTPGETVLGTVSRHWWALARPLGPPLALCAGAAAIALLSAWAHLDAWPLALAPGICGLLWALLCYLNFVDDAYIFTTRRILSVQRRFFILHAQEEVITYDKIQKCTLVTPNLLGKLLWFGSVTLEVSGAGDPLVLDLVPLPERVLAAVDRNREMAQRGAKVDSANRERAQMRDWFAEVLAEAFVTAPDLHDLTLEDALVRAYGMGLRLVVLGDTVTLPGYAPGIVVSQSPSAGARAVRGGDISVILTRS